MANQNVVNAAAYFTELINLIGAEKDIVFPISGQTYFVSDQGDNVDGLTWETAFTTVAAAIAASNTNIALTENTKRRNRIFIDRGVWNENLSVLPNHCDMVGTGLDTMLQGVQHITTAVWHCRIFNIHFRNASGDTATPLFKITPSCHGLWLIDCLFDTRCVCTAAIQLVYHGNQSIKIKQCTFYGNWQPENGIQLDGGFMFGEIIGNFIRATDVGILVAHECTTWDYHSVIKENVITGVDSTQSSLAKGIALMSSVGNSKMMIIGNWIAADVAIYYANDVNSHSNSRCIDNHVTEGGTGGIEVSGS